MAKLLSDLPIGSLVKDPNSTFLGSPIIWKIADKNHTGYPTGAITLITDRCIAMRCFDAQEPNNSTSARQNSGNGRYAVSNIRQWLNSDAEAGKWYSAQHSADAAPDNSHIWQSNSIAINSYDTNAGFLNGFSQKFKNSLMETNLIVAKNNVDGGGSETVTDKIFLASNTEVGLENENSVAEGALLQIFSDNASRVAYVTAEGIVDSNYESDPLNDTTAWYWWLRTPVMNFSGKARYVNSSGALYSEAAYYGDSGVRPLCNLPSSILVSNNPDENGIYTMEFYPLGYVNAKGLATALTKTKEYVDNSIANITVDVPVYTHISAATTTTALIAELLPIVNNMYNDYLANKVTVLSLVCTDSSLTNFTDIYNIYTINSYAFTLMSSSSRSSKKTMPDDSYTNITDNYRIIEGVLSSDNTYVEKVTFSLFGYNQSSQYLDVKTNYSVPYEPLYDGSPATKKYVDDSIAAISVTDNLFHQDKEKSYTSSSSGYTSCWHTDETFEITSDSTLSADKIRSSDTFALNLIAGKKYTLTVKYVSGSVTSESSVINIGLYNETTATKIIGTTLYDLTSASETFVATTDETITAEMQAYMYQGNQYTGFKCEIILSSEDSYATQEYVDNSIANIDIPVYTLNSTATTQTELETELVPAVNTIYQNYLSGKTMALLVSNLTSTMSSYHGLYVITAYKESLYIRLKRIGYEYTFSVGTGTSSLKGLGYYFNGLINDGAITEVDFYQNSAVTGVLETDEDYTTPYEPQYDGSPATKKYVDDKTPTIYYSNNLVTGGNMSSYVEVYNFFSAIDSNSILIDDANSDTIPYTFSEKIKNADETNISIFFSKVASDGKIMYLKYIGWCNQESGYGGAYIDRETMSIPTGIKVLEASIDNVIDFNTLTEPGTYLIKNAGASTCTNIPSDISYGSSTFFDIEMTVISRKTSSNTWIWQNIVLSNSGYTFFEVMRQYSNSSWGEWKDKSLPASSIKTGTIPSGVSCATPTADTHLANKVYVDSTISTNAMPASSIVNNFWIGTQSEYDAITTKSVTTLYMIKEG